VFGPSEVAVTLAHIDVREVYSIELVPELAETSAARLQALGCANVDVRQGDGYFGWPEHAPFDRILVTAATPSVPSSWLEQLADGGVLVAPVGGGWPQSLLRYRKHRGHTTRENLAWVAFVPCRRAEQKAPPLAGDSACVAFLQWALPRLNLRWPGFRKVRKLVCKRVVRRARELGLEGLDAYRARLEASPEEWARFDELCRIPISRFYRDRAVFDSLRSTLLPHLATCALARGERTLHAWSVGCASGEEPYSLSMAWQFDVARRFRSLALDILATDADEVMLERARRGCYAGSSLKLLPAEWRSLAFRDQGGSSCIRDELRERVTLSRQDVRTTMPDGPFDLALCRNVVFTYFEPELQRTIAERIVDRMAEGGVLVVGCHEVAPPLATLSPFPGVRCAYVAAHTPRPSCAPGFSGIGSPLA
jgi:chemotaxis protein methyltransferase CheR